MKRETALKLVGGLGALGLIGLLGYGAAAFLLPTPGGLCADSDPYSRTVSPDGRYVVRVFVRDCGATTNWATHVALEPMNNAGGGESVVVYDGDRVPVVTWQGSSAISIEEPAGAEAFGRKDQWRDVSVTYVGSAAAE